MKKKLIQLGVTFGVILVVGAALVGAMLEERYAPTKEMADLYDYYDMGSKDEILVLMQGELTEDRGLNQQGVYYVPLDLIKERVNDRFYWDSSVDTLVYTTPTELYKMVPGESSYRVNHESVDAGYPVVLEQEGVIYLALDFAKGYSDFYYEIYEAPARIQIFYDWKETEYVSVVKDTQVRVLGGIKSEILEEVQENDRLYYIEAMDEWSCVRTQEGLTGYIKNDCISDSFSEMLVNREEYRAPEYTSIALEEKVNLAFHQIGGACDGSTLRQGMSGVTGVNVVAPTWFFLSDKEGNLISLASQEYVDAAHEMGIAVWGLVENMTYDASTYEVVTNMASRENLVDQLVQYALDYNLDGINVDFEALSFDAEAGYIQFIRELSIPCRENGIVLSIDNYVPSASSEHYNRKEQGIVADYVIIMGYDEHYAGTSEYGSTASIGFVEDGIVNTLEEVPAEKVINAIPFYTRVYKQTPESQATNESKGVLVEDGASEFGRYLLSSQAVSMSTAKQLLSNHDVTPVWNEALGQYYGEYISEGCKYMVWLEDETSIARKMELVKKYDLAGVAEWSLNLSSSDIWPVISSYLQGDE